MRMRMFMDGGDEPPDDPNDALLEGQEIGFYDPDVCPV